MFFIVFYYNLRYHEFMAKKDTVSKGIRFPKWMAEEIQILADIEASYEEADDELVWRLAERIKAELRQEAVMIRKDHEVHFV